MSWLSESVITFVTLLIAIAGFVLGVINTLWQFNQSRVKVKLSMRLIARDEISSNYKHESAFFLPTDDLDSVVRIFHHRGRYSPFICINVANLSSFAIHVEEMGFCSRFYGSLLERLFFKVLKTSSKRFPLRQPSFRNDGVGWLSAIEPRANIAFYFRCSVFGPAIFKSKCVYIRTSCGAIKRLNISGAHKALNKALIRLDISKEDFWAPYRAS